MGGKKKVGKARRDKFYHLAKETGYRARSAFKLIQLNRKFGFLERSRVCIDLCAAPGGWCQVAANHMPVSSVIVGVDLVPIRAIPKVTTLVDDITSDKCRADLKKELKDWKADVVLNDGAPNVGQNWLQDAFSQAGLTLHALKLASEFLRKGGWFVSKVFRSQDYHALLWVFKQLFNKVHATKPQASRNESAEIFIVCQGYLAPDKLDPKFLDPKAVFKALDGEPSNKLDLLRANPKKKAKAEGYAEGDYTQHSKLSVTEFIRDQHFLDRLASASELVVDDEKYLNHPATTAEILECCKDIKILGKTDVRTLIAWRKKLLKSESEAADVQTDNKEASEPAGDGVDEDSESDEEKKMDAEVSKVRAEVEKDAKRKKKKAAKVKSKLREKMNLNMIKPDDHIEQQDDENLFDLKAMKTKSQLENIASRELDNMSDLEWESEDEEEEERVRHVAYDRMEDNDDAWSDGGEGDDSGNDNLEDVSEQEYEDENEINPTEANPLLADLGQTGESLSKQAELWFKREVFDGLDTEADEDYDIDEMMNEHRSKGGTIRGADVAGDDNNGDNLDQDGLGSDGLLEPESSESDTESDDSDYGKMYDRKKYANGSVVNENADMEVVKAEEPIPKLDAAELALGTKLITSKKSRRRLIEGSFNRYAFHDDNLPDWFMKDEKQHMKRRMPVTKADIQEYKAQMKAVDARPIKKIAEAKGRKKKKMMKRLEKARKKAEALEGEAGDGMISEKEKWQQIKSIYKKATKQKKPERTYVVAKKGVGKRVSRPAGVKGRFKVVDPRMKKDSRAKKVASNGKGKNRKQNTSRSSNNKRKK